MKQKIKDWQTPFVLMATLFLAFGTQIHHLGFYWDDWPVIYLTHMQGLPEFWEFYRFDRPISAWTYVITTPILGIHPLGWHIFTLLLRWLTVIFAWQTLRELWPHKKNQVAWMAVLFAIYPSFDQQAISVAFSQHWLCYLIFMISLWLMIRGIRQRSTLLLILSYLLTILHLWTMEYFAGLELVRPFILLILASELHDTWKQRLGFSLKKELPYLIIFFSFIVWRFLILEFPSEDPSPLKLLVLIREHPLSGLLQLAQVGLKDTFYLIIGVWQKATAIQFMELDSSFLRLAAGLSILNAGLVWFYFRKAPNAQTVSKDSLKWEYQAISLGLIIIIAGVLPPWLMGRSVSQSFYSSRFTLASMFGLGLFVIGFLEWLTPRYLVKLTLVATMVLTSTNYHIRISQQYKDSWSAQKNFYWQLYWRAPNIMPNTPFISDNELLHYAGGYATAMGLNLMYNQGAQPDNLAYWFFNLDDKLEGQMFRLRERKALQAKLRIIRFYGKSFNSLVIDNSNGCIKVIEAGRVENELLPEAFDEIIPVANLARIQPKHVPTLPEESIFGREAEHTWCYYYQKAELARQGQNWEHIADIGDQVFMKGYTPRNHIEWLVFIEGYVLAGQMDTALELTMDVYNKNNDAAPQLCTLWSQMEQQEKQSMILQDMYLELVRELDCSLVETLDE